jgi:PAS domain S-box-containing protein
VSAETQLILVVEDDPGTATLQRRRLERAGFRVAVASDVDRAIEILSRESVALVVMDYRLGPSTGLDLNRRIKAAGFEVPVILVSGGIDEPTVIEAIRAGVKDVLDKGTDYLDYLPEAVRGVLNQAAAVPDRLLSDQRRTRVLVVEDDEGVAILERKRLERAGYTVDVVTNAEEALKKIRGGHVHLALLDLRLDDDQSGLDLYERVRAEGWDIPAILVTAFPDHAAAIRALRAGIRDFVPKSGEFLDYLPTAVDRVISQVRVEHKLVESELRLASIIGTAMDAIVMCDEQLRIILFNRSAEQMFEVLAAEALTKPLAEFIPDLNLSWGEDSGNEIQRRVELEAVRRTGDRIPVELSISAVAVHGRRLFTVIARDITERRRTEAEMREADHRKDVFLGMLAHELRNPLAAITTAVEVLHRSTPVESHRMTNVIRRQTAGLARMVDDLLDVSRVTLGKIQLSDEPLLLGETVSRSVESVRDAATRGGVDLQLDVAAEPVWLVGDSTRLEQVLTNLLTNAIKFTPTGGRITVSAVREGAEAVVHVRDTGIGIERSLLPKVFDLFVQGDTSLDRSKSGLGIGLALVRQVVQLHGGRVTAYSAGPGTGSEFTVCLPAAPEDAPAEQDAAEPGGLPQQRLDVLIVDDHPDLADCVALLVETFGHRATAMYSGRDAVARARRENPDVMLVDIGMPDMTGYDVAKAIRSDPATSGIRLVALTGYGREEDRARVFAAGFDLHLTKPVADDRLREVLDELGAGGGRP